jgi:hypothetical protein
LRPGLDGACTQQRCFTPWQLVALELFTENRPLPAVPDMSFGFSAERLSGLLGEVGKGIDALQRIETQGYLFANGRLSRVSRLRAPRAEATRSALEVAKVHAERHILAAQGGDGAFRYMLQPFTGNVQGAPPNIARQAGTTLVLCELSQPEQVREVVLRALSSLATFEQKFGEISTLNNDASRAKLGRSALPLAALLSCRNIVGPSFDELADRLGKFLLRMQRDNGSFYSEFDIAAQVPRGNFEQLYGAGQAILALVLLEQRLAHAKTAAAPSITAVNQAITRAMDYYAGPYWRRAPYDFFFLEENWHCLAARAALSSHRHAGYEQFCIDYVTFKSRLILDAEDVPDPDVGGGYSVSHVFPPHNTATAGFGEAMAAAVVVKKKRGLDVTRDVAVLKNALSFLVHHQWDETSAAVASSEHQILGGFSEHFASPVIRIDYVQHAMAALGHGLRALDGS